MKEALLVSERRILNGEVRKVLLLQATLKGMTESQTGIVFGIFELVMFVVAPVFGKNVSSLCQFAITSFPEITVVIFQMIRIGSKNMFTFGLGLTGVTAIMFG